MKRKSTILLDEHLPILNEMVEVGTDDFFYTRLKARLEKEAGGSEWSFPVKPAWLIATLFILLALNCFTLIRQHNSKDLQSETSSIQSFAASYDQTINTSIQ
jgi:hypothetical protein